MFALINRLLPGGFTLALLATVAIATILPCTDAVAIGFSEFTGHAIGVMFFLHGAKLPLEEIIVGMTH
jgi:sodium/bile acid cotransporter 7